MAELLQRTGNDCLSIDNNVFHIYDPAVMEAPDTGLPDFSGTGLLAVTLSGPAVVCGTHMGEVDVTVEVWDGAPELDADGWQDVAETALSWDGEAMAVWGDDEELPVPIPGPGTYRLRVSGRHRDDGEDRDEDDPVEEFLLQLWPAPPSAPQLHRAASDTSTYWRTAQP